MRADDASHAGARRHARKHADCRWLMRGGVVSSIGDQLTVVVLPAWLFTPLRDAAQRSV